LTPGDDCDAVYFGGKGGALARLITRAQPVPVTGVVTTDAYHRVVLANPAIQRLTARIEGGFSASESEVETVFVMATVPAKVETALVALARRVGGARGHVAIRSSATVEDLGGSSFAGQYRSFLNINTADAEAVMDAIRRVWASLWYPAPAAYRRAFATVDTGDIAMAVVVMDMIPATTAGVVFTADPGGSDGARVEAVEGLGESLVSGERTPSAWVVPHDTHDNQTGTPALPIAARRALDLALSIEHDFGVPQDIEWAACDDDVYIVQARPITVLETDDGFDTDIDDHELTSAGIAELVPGVLAPLMWDLNAFLLEHAFRSVLNSLGTIGADAEVQPFIRRVRGRVAVDFDQLSAAASVVPGAVAELEMQYFGETSDTAVVTPRRADGLRRLHRDVRTARTRRQTIDQADVLVAAVAELRDRKPMLRDLSNDAVFRYLNRLLALAARGLTGELGVAASGGASFDRLIGLLDSYLGDDHGSLAAQRVTAHSGASVVRDPAASAALFGGPSWTELGLVPPQPDPGEASMAEHDLADLEQRVRSRPGWMRRRVVTGQFVDIRMHLLRRTVADVMEQLRRREASKAAFLEVGGEVRRVHLEFGRRLVAKGSLTQREDIELLSTSEVVSSLAGEFSPPNDLIKRRRNWLSRYDVEGLLPLRFTGVPDRARKPLPEGAQLTGWAASPGRYRGTARVVSKADDVLVPGEVLVAQATDASWSPLFIQAGAVVVERGGPLSHAAILARELGLPAVLNIESATELLQGHIVSVDGDQGVVVIEDPDRVPEGNAVA